MKSALIKTIFLLGFFLYSSITIAQKRIIFAPHWLAQAQFAGYYVALDKGLYKEAGLDVIIKPLNLTKNNTAELLNGEADIASLFLDKAILLAQKNDILNICQTSQNSSLVIVGHKYIKELSDLHGRTIGHWRGGFGLEFFKILEKKNIIPISVEYNSGINYFIAGAVDAMINTEYNELFTTLNSGLHINSENIFYLRDYGINTPEEGLYCLTKNLKPEYLDFVKASIAGWEYTKTHKKEALQIVYKYMKKDNIPINRALQEWMLSMILQLQRNNIDNNESTKSFILREKDYIDLCKLLLDQGDIEYIKPYNKFVYTK